MSFLNSVLIYSMFLWFLIKFCQHIFEIYIILSLNNVSLKCVSSQQLSSCCTLDRIFSSSREKNSELCTQASYLTFIFISHCNVDALLTCPIWDVQYFCWNK